MADARSKAVLNQLADLFSRANYVIDKMTNLRAPLAKGDIVEVPHITALTVNSTGTGSDVSQEDVTTSVLSLNANLDPMINARMPILSKMQLLDGNWPAQLAMQATIQIKNSMDETLCRDYLADSLCYDAAGTYHDNVAGDALTEDDLLNAKAAILSNDGARPDSLALFVSPYAEGSINSIAGFIPNGSAAEAGNLGIPRLGTVYGMPVFSTNSVATAKSVATTAVSVTSNVATATVAAGHGLTAGMFIKNAGLTDSGTNTGSVAITSVTATTVVFPFTAGDGAQADGIGTLTLQSHENLLVDTSQVFVAQQQLPQVRIVPELVRSGDMLQITAVWGRIGRAGRCRVLHSPLDAVS